MSKRNDTPYAGYALIARVVATIIIVVATIIITLPASFWPWYVAPQPAVVSHSEQWLSVTTGRLTVNAPAVAPEPLIAEIAPAQPAKPTPHPVDHRIARSRITGYGYFLQSPQIWE